MNAGADPNFQSEFGTPFLSIINAITFIGLPTRNHNRYWSWDTVILGRGKYIQNTSTVERMKKIAPLIIKAFLACGADYKGIFLNQNFSAKLMEFENLLKKTKPYVIRTITNFETDKAGLFIAIETGDYNTIKTLSQHLPFKMRNAAGNSPLHHAILTLKGDTQQNFTELNQEAQNSMQIIILLLRVLPRLASFKNSRDQDPIFFTIPSNKFWILKFCFIKAAALDLAMQT